MLKCISSSCSGNHSVPQGCCSPGKLIITVGVLASALLILLGPLLAQYGLINAVTTYSLLAGGSVGFIFFLSLCKKGKATLLQATFTGDYSALPSLIEAGEDVNQHEEGFTPLLNAIFLYKKNPFVSTSMVRLLISKGARFDLIVEKQEWSPLGLAIAEGHSELVEILLQGRGDPEAPCKKGDSSSLTQTPLLLALQNISSSKETPPPATYTSIVKYLIDKRVRFDVMLKENALSPLGYAIEAGLEEAVELLLTGQGDLEAPCSIRPNQHHRTPLEVAEWWKTRSSPQKKEKYTHIYHLIEKNFNSLRGNFRIVLNA